MSDLANIPLQSPISVWQRPVQVRFGCLAQALGKGAIAGAFGNWEGLTASGGAYNNFSIEHWKPHSCVALTKKRVG